jgi:DNA-binding transcriptional MocR family regulator
MHRKIPKFAYEKVADRLETLIEKEVFQVGDRLPSVRSLREQYGISISTALQVYHRLERKGLVEPREKSGYFVQFSRKRHSWLRENSNPDLIARPVTIAEIVTEVRDSAAREGLVNLSSPMPPPELLPAAHLHTAMLQTIRQFKPDYLRYPMDQGDDRLQRQIAMLSARWGGTVSEEEIVVTHGCMEAISLCLQAVAKPGDTIITESPTFYGFLQTIQHMDMKVLELPTNPVTGLCLDKLETAIRRRKVAACLLVNSFNNPLGSCMPQKEKKDLVQLLGRYDIPLIEDDIYGDLYLGEHRPRPAKVYDRKGLVLHCSSFSKTLAPGMRIGWVLPGRYRERIVRIKYMQSIAANHLLQRVIAQYLETNRYERHLKKLRQALSVQMMQTLKAVQHYFPENVFSTCPQGGMTLWLQLPPTVDSYLLYRAALEQDIHLTPGLVFSTQKETYRNYLRLSYAEPWSGAKEQAIAWIGQYLKKQK